MMKLRLPDGLSRKARPVCLFATLAIVVAGCEKEPEYVRKTPGQGAAGGEAQPGQAPQVGVPETSALRPATEAERANIKRAYDDFARAVIEDDGDLALSALSEESIAFFGTQLISMALHMPEEGLLQQPYRIRFNVLLIRCAFPHAELKAVEGDAEAGIRALIEKNGSMLLGPLDRTTLGEIFIESGRVAHAEAIFDGKTQPAGYRFVLTDDGWKLDLDRLLYAASIEWERSMEQSGNVNGALTEFIRPLSEQGLTVHNFWGPVESEDGTPAPTTMDVKAPRKKQSEEPIEDDGVVGPFQPSVEDAPPAGAPEPNG